ncbi:unnamed protein product, partial [Pylaiella littoralis]
MPYIGIARPPERADLHRPLATTYVFRVRARPRQHQESGFVFPPSGAGRDLWCAALAWGSSFLCCFW